MSSLFKSSHLASNSDLNCFQIRLSILLILVTSSLLFIWWAYKLGLHPNQSLVTTSRTNYELSLRGLLVCTKFTPPDNDDDDEIEQKIGKELTTSYVQHFLQWDFPF